MEKELPPNTLILPPIEASDYMKGDIRYEVRCEDWRPLLTTKEPQKFKFDSNGCTQNSGINVTETQFNFLKKDMSSEMLRWFTNKGYIDANGNFDFSWRYTGIKAGCSINGSSHFSFWGALKTHGVIPRKMLNYTLEESQKFTNQEDMCADFWNSSVITSEMDALAQESKQWFDVAYEYTWYNLERGCPATLFMRELKHAPLHIGTAVCWNWNSEFLVPCEKDGASHSTMGWKANVDESKVIRDTYNPYDKTIAAGYRIAVAVKGVITLKDPMIGPNLSLSVWERFIEILRQVGVVLKGK